MNIYKDVCITISRILVGIVLLAHGWQKYNSWTIDGTAKSFESMSVPWPNASAQFATYFELAAGVLLILGLLVRIVGPILFVQMVFAFGFAHWGKGVFVSDGGWELVGLLGAAGLALAAYGSGRFSLDYLFMTPVRARKERKEKTAKEAETARGNEAFGLNNGNFAPAGAPAGSVGNQNMAPNSGQAQGQAQRQNPGQNPFGNYGSPAQRSNSQGLNSQGANNQSLNNQGANNQSNNMWNNARRDTSAAAGGAGVIGGSNATPFGSSQYGDSSNADAPTTQWNSNQGNGPSSNSFGDFSSSGSGSSSDGGSDAGGDGGGDGGGGD
ncbi:DoxX family protein [Corynebacterium sp. 22_2729]